MKTIKTFNFDWDDNILFMPTKIVIFHKDTNQAVEISTEKFGQIRSQIGVEGEYKDYKINGVERLADGSLNPDFSFIQFRDRVYGETNDFLPQVKEAVKSTACFGPSFQAFCEALSDKKTAKKTTIITARGHHPQSIHDALVYMQSLGHFKHLPTIDNIHPVSSKRYDASAANPSQKKLDILMSEFDKVDKLSKNGTVTVEAGFSDDDLATYQNVKKVVEEQAKNNRWPNTKIVLYYTGHNPETVIINPEIVKVAA